MTEKTLVRRILLAAVAILVVLSGYKALKTEFDADLLSVLPAELPEVRGIKLYRDLFLDRTDFIVVLEGEAERCVAAAEQVHDHLIAELPELEGRISWRAPWENSPELSGELAAYSRCIANPEAFAEFAKRLTDPETLSAAIDDTIGQLSEGVSEERMKRLSLDPLGIGDLGEQEMNLQDFMGLDHSGPEAKMRLLLIDAPPLPNNIKELRIWNDKVTESVGKWVSENQEEAKGIEHSVTGRGVLVVEINSRMKEELFGSGVFTVVAVLLLFFAFYGRVRPLLLLSVCLFITILFTFAAAHVIYDKLGILSVGFAAILIGIVVDYGIVIYQELQICHLRFREVIRLLFAPILWAAFTTGGVFLFLSRSAIPGIAQLGNLVAIGVILGAVVMLLLFAPLSASFRAKRHGGESGLPSLPTRLGRWVAAGMILASAAILITMGFPRVNSDPETLRPTGNKAIEFYESFTERLSQKDIGRRRFIVADESEKSVAEALREVEKWTKSRDDIQGTPPVVVPSMLWPNPAEAAKNLENAAAIVRAAPETRKVLEEEFQNEAIAFFDEAISYFERFVLAEAGQVPAPANEFSEAVLDHVLSREPGELAALGSFHPDNTAEQTDLLMKSLHSEVPQVLSGGWEHLTGPLKDLFASDLRRVVLPIIGVLAVILLLVFRRPGPVIVTFFTLLFSFLTLLAVMRVAGVSWNLFNLAAVPLLLGLGLDYSIHMNLAAARLACDDPCADRRVARALLVCSLSSAAGFASLTWSSHPGLSSLGIICSMGIPITMFVATLLVPSIVPREIASEKEAKQVDQEGSEPSGGESG